MTTNEDIEAIMAEQGGKAGAAAQAPAFEASTQAGPGVPDPSSPSGVPKGDAGALALLHDLPLPVSVELGRTRLSVHEILAMGRGSVIQLDRLAGEPVDLYVGDRKFAQGEVVVLGEQFGVRISRILPASPAHPGGAR